MSVYTNRRYRYEGNPMKLVTRWDRADDPGWAKTKQDAMEVATAPAREAVVSTPKPRGYGKRRVTSR